MPSSSTIHIRPATVADIPAIVHHRRRMCEDMNYTDHEALSAMETSTALYLKTAIPDGSFHSWLACDNDKIVAGGAVIVSPWPAHAYEPQCRRVTIMNVYTEPGHRRKGIARQLVQTMITWCQQQGFARVTLHASDQGKHLYKSLGFEDSNEMRLNLR